MENGSDIYVVSDIHLKDNYRDSDIEQENWDSFINFLEMLQAGNATLFLLGDIFDVWYEYNNFIIKHYYKIYRALEKVAESGTRIIYVAGNHDFYFRDFLQKQIGVEIIDSFYEMQAFGKKFLLHHGDLLDESKGYRLLRRLLRSSFVNRLISSIHPEIGYPAARKVSGRKKNYDSSYEEFLKKHIKSAMSLLEKENGDVIITGHTHKKEYIDINGRLYINCGVWSEDRSFVHISKDSIKLKQWRYNGG